MVRVPSVVRGQHKAVASTGCPHLERVADQIMGAPHSVRFRGVQVRTTVQDRTVASLQVRWSLGRQGVVVLSEYECVISKEMRRHAEVCVMPIH
jgi:hypothetical protein